MKLKCEECGRVFENERRRKYCSTACRMKRYYRKCGTQIDKLNADIARQNVRRSEARRAMKARLAERDAAYAAAFPGNPGVRRVGAIRFSDQQAAMAGILSRFR